MRTIHLFPLIGLVNAASLMFSRHIDGSGSRTPWPRAEDACATPVPNSCSFYPDCVESKEHCGSSGYPIGYGFKYCNLFSAAESRFSPAGQAWVSKTMLCLQQALVPYGAAGQQSLTCPALKDFAFSSHPRCYVDSGVCLLPPSDWVVIVETISLKELLGSFLSLKQVLQTSEDCAGLYMWLIEKGIVNTVRTAENNAADIWHDFADWA